MAGRLGRPEQSAGRACRHRRLRDVCDGVCTGGHLPERCRRFSVRALAGTDAFRHRPTIAAADGVGVLAILPVLIKKLKQG
jgi:hypothetical protein